MDHKTFIAGLSRQLGLDPDRTEGLTDSLLSAIKSSACELDSIAIPGFGRFEAAKTDEYIAEDPTDGVMKLFPPSISLSFTPGSMLKQRMSHE